ncbi:MAG: tetratricopeptide repeat protein [Candidatus Caldatribacterium sp.]|nr:tetratricopeptide repeat protein [Candidatus Caldatribacterium sp.]
MPLRMHGDSDFHALIKRARREFLQGYVERAKELFLAAAEILPNHPEVLHGFGVIALREGKYKEAVAYLKQAVQQDPSFAEAWNNLGFALFKKGCYKEAQEALEKAVALDPNEVSFRKNLESLCAKMGVALPKAQPLISLCMIVRDEEENLKKYLAHMVDAFEDVVVVDTGSRDGTKDVAASLGARVFSVPRENDFSKARNASLKKAKGQWILILDADEMMELEDIKRLQELARREDAMGIQLPIYNHGRDNRVGVINFAVRLFRNHPKIRFAGRIHETVEASIARLSGSIGRANIPIHHFGYTDAEKLRQKTLERNLPLLEGILRENPNDPQVLLYVAKTYLAFLGDRERAQEMLLRIIRNPALRGRPAYIEGLLYLGNIFLDKGEITIARRVYEKVCAYDPHLPDGFFALGNLALLSGNYAEALEMLERVFSVDAGKSKANLIRFTFDDKVLYDRLMRAAIGCQQWGKALQYGEELLKMFPEDPNVLHNLGLVYFHLGAWDKAEAFWRDALRNDPKHPEARSLLFYLYTLSGRTVEARGVLQEVMTVF